MSERTTSVMMGRQFRREGDHLGEARTLEMQGGCLCWGWCDLPMVLARRGYVGDPPPPCLQGSHDMLTAQDLLCLVFQDPDIRGSMCMYGAETSATCTRDAC